ncbi:MAG: hypothetical protein ACOCSF_02380 [Halanaeroarchaeum sp.]
MDERSTRALGVASAIGGILLVLASIPPSWYGVPSLDSYVFDPSVGSPLWFHRTVVPVLSILGVVGLSLGAVGLVQRDWGVAGRLRRWSGVLTVVSLGSLAVSVPLLSYVSFGDSGATSLAILAGVVFAAISVVVLTPALLLLGYAITRTERPYVGYALLGVTVALPVAFAVTPAPFGSLVAALVVLAVGAVVGHDLYHYPGPLPERVPGGS